MLFIFTFIFFHFLFISTINGKQENKQQPTIQHIHIVGEKCSGTNFLRTLLLNNIEDISIHNSKTTAHYLPKHHFITNDAIKNCSNCIFIHLHRQPYDWIRSLFLNKEHTPRRLRSLNFSEWIRIPWRHMYGIGNKTLWEQDPDTGKKFENILKLRTKKLTHFEELRNSVKHFYSVSYNVVNNNSEAFLKQIASLFSLKLKPSFTPVIMYEGYDNSVKKQVYEKKEYFNFLPEDLAFINAQLEWDNLENMLGYTKIINSSPVEVVVSSMHQGQ